MYGACWLAACMLSPTCRTEGLCAACAVGSNGTAQCGEAGEQGNKRRCLEEAEVPASTVTCLLQEGFKPCGMHVNA